MDTEPSTTRRWAMLVASILGAMATTCTVSGVGFLIPELHTGEGMSIAAASTLATVPTIGLMLTIIPWGAALDRFGERRILLISLGLTVVATTGAAVSSATDLGRGVLAAWLLIGGMASAATNGASGRIVVGWFPPRGRGTAMGVRQTAQPLGIGLCALTIPVLSAAHDVTAGLWVPVGMSLAGLVAVAVTIVDPPRTSTATDVGAGVNPYRASSFLPRVHAVSVLLVIPQSTLWTFVPAWLIVAHHWAPGTAGVLVTVSQVLGAAGRIAAGRWSDVWGSRMKPIRVIALGAAVSSAVLALTDWVSSPVAAAVMVVATVITVADNGLAFTGIAEYAGPSWSGRALAVQNTGQFLATSATTPVFGALIGAAGFPLAFAVMSLAPLVALPLVPRDPAPRPKEAGVTVVSR
ncbi:MFS transporter [Williamsia sp. Leaf354]|jgi:MFS family permease|uniref:MFS transporter n=1 Tax=Williamsia sp. Leaf354 TaxID=1736349 RepID=UPI0006F50E1E|nr:MFS transporter [Williamsia sp. Leaf354]KQR97985.1 MFS transporter [Williamsia sp. Leaf354]